ncbi:MAG: PAS domain S-box protein [bacterium]|nr:PAS domain S-box protein [bacterium]
MIQETGFRLYILPASIVTITYLVLSLVLLHYLRKLKDKSRPTRMLTASFTGFTIFLIANLLNAALEHTLGFWKEPLTYMTFLTTMAFFLQFAYAFPRSEEYQRKEARWVWVLSLSVVAAAAVLTVFYFYSVFSGTIGNIPLYSILSGFIALECIWGIIVFLRRAVRLEMEKNPSPRRRILILFKPAGREVRACRNFGLLLSVPLWVVLLLQLGEAGIFPEQYTNLVMPIAIILFYYNFALVYLNHARETNTFMIKLVGASLVMVLGTLGALAYLVSPTWDKEYRYPFLITESRSVHFQPRQEGGYQIETLPTRFDPGFASGEKLTLTNLRQTRLRLEFPFPFSGRQWDTIYIYRNGVVTFGAPMEVFAFWSFFQPGISPLWLRAGMDSRSGIFYQKEPGKITITWAGLLERKTGQRRTLQLVLRPDGRILFNFRDIKGCRPIMGGVFSGGGNFDAMPVRFGKDLDTPLYSSPSQSIVEYHYGHYQQYFHDRLLPLTLMVLLVSLVILMVFPLFFRNNMLAPVKELLKGVKKVKEGTLPDSVPVRYNDEIGVLTGSFNHMVQAIRDAKNGWTEADKTKDRLLALHQAVLDTAAEGIITLDGGGAILSFNEAAGEMFSYRREEVINKPDHILLDQRNNPSHMGFLAHFNASGSQKRFGVYREFLGKRKDMTLFPLEFSVSVTGTPEGRIYTVILHDLSEHHRLEAEKIKLREQLNQSRKLETVGSLAGGVARDLQNILTPVRGYVQSALQDIPGNSMVREWLNDIMDSCARARGVADQILTFSRKSESLFRVVDLYPIVKRGLDFLRSTFPSTIAFHPGITPHPSGGKVFGDSNQLQLVLVNLCTNAVQAMPHQAGALYVSLERTSFHEPDARPHLGLKQGDYIMLRVKDTGHGMDRETMERIFEPFFTTKPVGQGSGLGLSVVHGIVEKHGGVVLVESQPGAGTAFTVYIPAYIPPVPGLEMQETMGHRS